MQTNFDVIVIGGGLIGLSLAWQLVRREARVLILDRREPGREASHAGGGMIANLDPVLPAELRQLADRSAQLYPAFVEELKAASGCAIDLRDDGVIAFEQHPIPNQEGIRALSTEEVLVLEPRLRVPGDHAYFMQERAVDPRDLVAALLAALRARPDRVTLAAGEATAALLTEHGRTAGVLTGKGRHAAARVVNCAGAWASQIGGEKLPTQPVKGHMVALAFPEELAMAAELRERQRTLRHVLRSRWCYIIPRSNGRYVVGSTVEPAGFDTSLNAYRVRRLQQDSARLVPSFAEAKIAEAWTGLRPGTPDNLPLMGETATPGYFAATGHYRDGILLAPVTAEVMAHLLLEGSSPLPLESFSPRRF